MTVKPDGGGETRLIFACSGGSDVGHLSDLGARAAAGQGLGKMHCLAGVGGRVEPILATARAAAKILAIDGCPRQCAKQLLEQAGFSNFRYLQLNDLGLTKGRSQPTAEHIQLVVRKAAELLA